MLKDLAAGYDGFMELKGNLEEGTKVNFILILNETCLFVCLVGVYVTPTQCKSYGDVLALLVEKDLVCLPMHYFWLERAPEQNHQRSVNET
jgi:hypothetical protein